MAIKTFMEQIRIVAQEIEFQKTLATENLATTCLENSLVFLLDYEPIPSVDTFYDSIICSTALGS